jgi:erythritol kinase
VLLGLDLGTTNVKALLTSGDGEVLAVGAAPVQIRHLPGGGVEQDLEDIFAAALAAIGQLADAHDLSAVRAVGVSAQGGAMQLADEAGTPVGPVISWLDARGRPWDEQVTAELGAEWFRRHVGHGRSGLTVGQVLRLRVQQPGMLTDATRVGFVGDAIVRRLCGRAAHDATSLGLTMLYNPSLDREDPDLLDRLGLRREQLPDLLAATQPAGALLEEVAEPTGLPAGIPVSPAIHDQYAAALGSGTVHAGDVMFGAGTAWVLLMVTDRLLAPVIDGAYVCRHPVRGLFGQILSLGNGGSAVSWMAGLVGLADGSASQLDERMAAVPPGCEGLRCRPLLIPGGGAGLAAETGGRLEGLQLSHTAGHLLRAVVEGLTCELARYLQFVVGSAGRIERLVMCGPAAGGQVTPQIVADTTGLPLACAARSEMSALGAAVIARALLEPGADPAALAEQMAAPFRVVGPSEHATLYQEILREYLAALPGGG